MENAADLTTNQLHTLLAECDALPQAVESLQDHLQTLPYRAVLLSMLAESQMDIPQIASVAKLSRACVYQAFEGIRLPARDTILRIALAMKLSLRQVQTLLHLSERGELYPRIRRDAILIFAIEHGFTLSETNESLRNHQERHFYDEE